MSSSYIQNQTTLAWCNTFLFQLTQDHTLIPKVHLFPSSHLFIFHIFSFFFFVFFHVLLYLFNLFQQGGIRIHHESAVDVDIDLSQLLVRAPFNARFGSARADLALISGIFHFPPHLSYYLRYLLLRSQIVY